MKLPGALFLAAFGLAPSAALHAADPAKVDYTDRNALFAPAPSVNPDKRAPELKASLQDRRLTPGVISPPTTAVGARPAAIDVTETRDKNLVTPDSRRPESSEPKLNAFDHRESRFQPDTDHDTPKLVTRYQTALMAASTTNQSRFPAVGAGTTARVNRFVFHRNTATPLGTTANAVSAAGGAAAVRP